MEPIPEHKLARLQREAAEELQAARAALVAADEAVRTLQAQAEVSTEDARQLGVSMDGEKVTVGEPLLAVRGRIRIEATLSVERADAAPSVSE